MFCKNNGSGESFKLLWPAGKAILIKNGIRKLLTKDVLIETIEKFSPKWAQPDLTCVTPIIPQKNLFSSIDKHSDIKAGRARKIKGDEEN